jgi:Concanavalin A-like lectin/glucanases superfamily
MMEQMIEPRPNVYSVCIIATFFLLLAACGAGSGPSESVPQDGGTIPLHIVWADNANMDAIQPQARIVCADQGVQTVTAHVYNPGDNSPIVSESWACEDHQGTIGNVPPGSYSVVVLGNNSVAQPAYHANATGVVVPAGGSSEPVTIELTPFVPNLSLPSNGVTLQWETISGAEDYEIDISENADMNAPTAYITSEPRYTPADLTDGVRYYWSVKANDAYGNQSSSSIVGSFVANTATCIDGITPVSYWRFDDTAQPLADSIGSNNATCGILGLTCPTQITGGVHANAQSFSSDSSTGLAVAVTNGDFDWAYNDSFTIAAWVKIQQNTLTDVIVGRSDLSTTVNLYWYLAISPDGMATARIEDRSGAGSGDSGQFTGTTVLTDDKWHYLVLVRDDGLGQNLLYVDAKVEASISIDYPSSGGFASNQPVTIGWIDHESGHRLTGFIDEVAIYNQALSSATIAKQLSNGLQGLGSCDPL